MQKIVILFSFTFLKRDYERFGIDILKKNFIVKIIDFSSWFYPSYSKLFNKDIFKEEKISIEKKSDFLVLNFKNEKLIIFDFLDPNQKSFWVRERLKSNNNIFLTFDLNPIPKAEIPKYYLFKRYINFILNPKMFFYLLKSKIYSKKNNYIPDINVLAGQESFSHEKTKKKIYVHSMDYDLYLKSKSNNLEKKNKPYAVFIDQDLITHPDMKIFNYGTPVTENKYYSSLLNFFKNFKKQTGLDIKCAIHPKSQNKKLKNLLNGIDYSIGNTQELIKNSSLVLLHSSTAMSFAVLYEKPVIFLTSNELNKSWLWPRIKKFSEYSCTTPINIDKDLPSQLNLNEILKLDKEKYLKYLNQYLKFPNTPDISLWEMVSKHLIS